MGPYLYLTRQASMTLIFAAVVANRVREREGGGGEGTRYKQCFSAKNVQNAIAV